LGQKTTETETAERALIEERGDIIWLSKLGGGKGGWQEGAESKGNGQSWGSVDPENKKIKKKKMAVKKVWERPHWWKGGNQGENI